MNSLFNQLFDYNFYCNKKIIERCSTLDQVPQKTISLFSHILNTHDIYNMIILGKQLKYNTWDVQDVNNWQDIHYENQRTTFEIITNCDDFKKRVDYETIEKRFFSNKLKDILFHIINHSTQHRGQILADFRANAIEPEQLDYISYKR